MGSSFLMVALLVGISYSKLAIADQPIFPHETANDDDLHEPYKFPTGAALPCSDMNRLMALWLNEPLPDHPTDISDKFDLLETRIFGNIEIVAPSLFTIADREVTGEFLARILTPAVFRAYTKCSSALFHKFMALYIKNHGSVLLDEDSTLYTLFTTSLVQLLPISAQSPDLLRQTVQEMVHQTWDNIIGDRESFVLRVGFEGVARFCEASYQRFLDQPILQSGFLNIVLNLILEHDVTCQNGNEVAYIYTTSIQDFEDMVQLVEKDFTAEFLDGYLKDKIDVLVEKLEVNKTEQVQNNAFPEITQTLAEEIHGFLNNTVEEFKELSDIIKQLNGIELMNYLNFLDENQEMILKEVLTHLGWNINSETNEEPPTPFLP